MTLQSSAARTVVKSLLFLLCLSISAGSADAKLLQLIQAVLSSNLTKPHWRMSQLIENNNVSDAKHPQVAIDPSGNAIVVWQQQDRIWANRYANGSWGTAQTIDANAGDAEEPQVAVDSLGNAIAVWTQNGLKIWSARYDGVTHTWQTAQLIEEDAFLPQVAIHTASGHTIAVWEHWPTDSSPANIHAAFYDMASDKWQKPIVQISPDSGDDALLPQVAIDESGNAIAVWQQDDGSGEVSIYASRYANGSWEPAQIIDSNTDTAGNPQVAVDSNGNAIVVWHQLYGGSSNIWANRYNINKGWATAQVIGTNGSSEPQVAVDFNGNAFAVWHQENSIWKVFARRYDVINDWGTVELIEDVFGDAKVPQVACDPAGHAFLVWQQSDGTHWNISSTRYAAGDWIIPHKVINNAGEAYNPQIAVNESGKAVAVWEQTDGINTSIWAARYE